MSATIITAARERLITGSFVFEFASNGLGRIAARAGADFLVFDGEHSGWTTETLARMVATTRPHGVGCVVRVPAKTRAAVSGTLDLGADAVLVPMVDSLAEAEQLVDWAKYPPRGDRGAAFRVAHDDFSTADPVSTMTNANDSTSVIVQIESTRGLEECEGIALVEGVDALWLGQYDLSNSMGVPGIFDDDRYLDAVTRIAEAARAAGIPAAAMAGSADEAGFFREQGYRIIALKSDIALYGDALRDALVRARELPDGLL